MLVKKYWWLLLSGTAAVAVLLWLLFAPSAEPEGVAHEAYSLAVSKQATYEEYVKYAETERRWIGKDGSQNGVRDDVEALLQQLDDPQSFSLSMAYAALLQELIKADNAGQVYRVAHYLSLAQDCMRESMPHQHVQWRLNIERQQFDTELRHQRYLQQLQRLKEYAAEMQESRSMKNFCSVMTLRYQEYFHHS